MPRKTAVIHQGMDVWPLGCLAAGCWALWVLLVVVWCFCATGLFWHIL